MAKYRVAGNAVVRIDSTAGGSLTAITAYVEEISGFGREYQSLDVTAFSDAAERVIPGIESSQEITLRGAFDDNGSADLLFTNIVGTIVTLEWNPRGTASGARKFTTEVLVTKYTVTGEVKGRVEYEVTCKQDGTVAIGTN